MNTRWDILGLGAVAVDDLIYVDRFPQPDTKTQIQSERRQGGGPTATALVAAARLGVRPAYYSVLGDDELSRSAIEELEGEGIDCSPVLRRAGARPYHATVIVDRAAGQRTILYSADGVTYPPPAEIPEALIAACRVLFVDGYACESALRAAELAQAHRIPVVADIENVAHPAVAELLRRADHLIISLELGRQVTGFDKPGSVVAALVHSGRICSAVTAGDQGCWYAICGGEVSYFPAFRVHVVDTTGCGDVFHGAYAASIACGEGISKAIRVATAAAGLKATQPGGRTGIPDRETVDRFLEADRRPPGDGVP
jgi:ribokinase